MNQKPDPVLIVSQSLLTRFGNDCGKRLPDVLGQIGLELIFREADSYEGALLRIKGVPRGFVVVNSKIQEESRKRFTIAHECGHFLLPDQQDLLAPCSTNTIENWDEELYRPEFDANRFAAEILMPRDFVARHLRIEPTFDSIKSIAAICGTSLTASAFRLIELTSFPAAIVWSQNNRVSWYKASGEFVRWIRKGELDDATFAADCFKHRNVPQNLESVLASAWLFEKGLVSGAQIWEHSVPLPNYGAVLSLLVMRQPIETDESTFSIEDSDLDPEEFTLHRKRWPAKK
jgi:Zn-dependent peptidase ImmA (M78 family)